MLNKEERKEDDKEDRREIRDCKSKGKSVEKA
jgi:hypothetical protein